MPKDAVEVARRCLILELLAQRTVLETEADEPAEERERARSAWRSREADLGIASALAEGERALLDRPVGALTEDELDDAHGRGLGAAVLLWALGRAPSRPTFAGAEAIIADNGLLGDGSVARARASSEAATLRPERELDLALSAYLRLRGKAREVDEPERVFAGIAAHHLGWVLDPEMGFDDDLAE